MATQFHVVYSSSVNGAGIFAGGIQYTAILRIKTKKILTQFIF